jgi:hypothetical protein
MADLTDLERRCVLPFYLTMMRLNALSHDVPFGALREVAQGTTDDEIARLLTLGWRPRVMGAWLASGRAQRLEAPLLKSGPSKLAGNLLSDGYGSFCVAGCGR